MSKKVGVLNLRNSISAMYMKYGTLVSTVIDDAMKEVARESTEDLKAVRRFSQNGNPSGEYSADWTWKIEPAKRWIRKVVVYNDEHYRLTHLLESGHSKYLWGRPTGQTVRGYEHIKPINDKAQEHFEAAVERRIQEIGADQV
jgi:hypothetical protein